MSEAEGSSPSEDRPGARKRQKQFSIPIWERIPFGVYIAVVGVVIVGLMIGLPTYFSQRHMRSTPPTDVAAVGKPAPGFSLQDLQGRTYTLTPGDGKSHLLVFYMGNF